MTTPLRLGLCALAFGVAQLAAQHAYPLRAQQLPGAPGQPTAMVTGNQVTLSWTAPTTGGTATSYQIVAGTSSGASNLGTFPVGNVTSITAPVANGVYFVRVVALNSAGAGPASAERSFTVGTVVTAPGTPGAPSTTVSGSNVTIVWTAPTSGGAPTHYLIIAGTTSGGSDLGVHNVGFITGLSVTLGPGTYFIRVVAVNAGGQSAPSAERSFTIAGNSPPGTPGPPTATVSGLSVTITWTAPATGGLPTHYLILAGNSSGSANLGTFNVGAGTSVTSPVSAGTYFVRVVAVNGAGQSAPSIEAQFVVGGGGGVNGGWNGLTASGGQVGFIITNNTLTDIVVTGAVGRCTFVTHVFNQSLAVSGNSFTFTRSVGGSLDPGFTFNATMSGSNASGTVVLTSGDTNCPGNSATISWTATNSGAGMPLVPGIPGGLQPFVFGRSIELDWIPPNTPPGATTYDVEIGTTRGGSEVRVINTTGLPLNSIGRPHINVPLNPGTYFVRVRGRNASGTGLPTPDQSFLIH